MVTRLRNINPVQFGLVYGVVAAIIALVFALVMLPFSALMAASGASGMRMFGAGMGVAFVIVAPILYFIIAFVGGLITAFVYNLVAGWTGGVEVTLSAPVNAVPAPPAAGYSL